MDPDDLVAEAWLHVARGIHSFEGDAAAFRSWVFVVGHHRLIDERRRRRRKPHDLVEQPVIERATTPEASAEDQALEVLSEEQVRAILDRLPAAQREVLLLRFIGDFTVTEIAGIIGKRPGAVQALLRRGLNRLRRMLDE